LLRCLLTCAACGRAMVGSIRYAAGARPAYRYYVCLGKDRVATGRDEPCTRRSVKAEELEAAVWSHLAGLLADPERLLEQFLRYTQRATEDDEGDRDLTRLRSRIEQMRRQEQRLVDAYQAEAISLAELAERRERVAAQRQGLEGQRTQLVHLRRQRVQARAVLADLTAFCERIRGRLAAATAAEKRAVLQLLVERVIVEEGSLEIRHVIPLRRLPL